MKGCFNDLRQLAFLNAEHLKRFSPKMIDLVHKTLFASLPRFVWDLCLGNSPSTID